MATVSAEIRLRPVRFGFLVRPDDSQRTQRIFRVNTCLWGGMFNPIIPVFTRVPDWWERKPRIPEAASQIVNGYVDFFEPDFVVEAEPGLARSVGFNRKRILQLDEILANDNSRDSEGYGLSVLALYRKLFKEEFQFIRRQSVEATRVIPKKKIFAPLAACLFGDFPVERDLAHFGKSFQESFHPKEILLDAKAFQEYLQSPQLISPLTIGHKGIEVSYQGGEWPALFVLDATKSRDLVDYWNLRGVRGNVIPAPIQWLAELSPFFKDLITRNHRPLPGNTHGVMLHLTVMFSRSIPEHVAKDLHRLHLQVGAPGANCVQFFYPNIWRPSPSFTTRSTRPILSAGTSRADASREADGVALRFSTLAPSFADRYGNNHRWVNVVQFDDWKGEIATTFPCNVREGKFPSFGNFAEEEYFGTEGYVAFMRYKESTEHWRLMTGSEAFEQWFKSRGISVRASPSGRSTQQIIQAFDGFWGVRSIANEGVIRLLNEMARSLSKSAHIGEFKNRVKAAGQGDIWREKSFETLVKRRAVQLGLEIRCAKCDGWTWFSLAQIDYKVTCDRCLKEYEFPVHDPANSRHARWAYRVVGPFALADYAVGGYAAALAIRLFADLIGGRDTDVSWSAGRILKLPDDQEIEADFVLWYQRKELLGLRYSTDTVFGEVKSWGSKGTLEVKDVFEEQDVARMKRLAEEFPGSILVFATLREGTQLAPAEIKRLRKLAEWGRHREKRRSRAPVIVLTATELFSSYDLGMTWKNKGGKHKEFADAPPHFDPTNLRRLAEATQQLYLKMPTYWEWLEAAWKRKVQRERRRSS